MKAIWDNVWLKESLLLIVTAVALVVGQAVLELADLLESSSTPIDDALGWLRAVGLSVVTTALRQAGALLVARLAGSQL